MSKTSLERFYAAIDRLETMLLFLHTQLQIPDLPTQPKVVSSSHNPIKWDHVVSSDDIKEYGI